LNIKQAAKMNFRLVTVLFLLILSTGYSQKLNPGDGVRIVLLNVTDNISGDYYIQIDGNLQLPFLGLLPTAELEFPDLRKTIMGRYESIYKDPELTVQPLFRINILGEVRNPGYYYVTDVERMTGILALAGGVTGAAAKDEIYIIRDDVEINLNVSEIVASGNTAADIGLQSGDRIFIPRSFWADAGQYAIILSGISVLTTLLVILLR
jgi:polysaccharide export outer membrane protein